MSIKIPPVEMQKFIGSNFKAVGKEFLQYCIDLCQLKRNGIFLDVGCGCGRIALPLTGYLNSDSMYEEFDVYRDGKEIPGTVHLLIHISFATVDQYPIN